MIVEIVADFAFGATQLESVVLSGVQTEVYTVMAVAGVFLPAGTVSTYAWSATPGVGTASPASGTGPSFVTVFTDLSSDATISLVVTDSLGNTSTAFTKTVPNPLTVPYVQRKLFMAATDSIESFDGGVWRETGDAATVVANGPVWAVGGTVVSSTNDLVSAVSSTPFGGTDVTALWLTDPSTVLAGASDGRVAISYDGASTWTVVTGPDSSSVLRCVISQESVSQWWVLTAVAVYQTSDYGASWIAVQAAASGETFIDLSVGLSRVVIAMSGGRVIIDSEGNQPSFPSGIPEAVLAVTADIGADMFYCYDLSGDTYILHFEASPSWAVPTGYLPGSGTPQPRGLWRDPFIGKLLYVAVGSAGVYKSVDGFASTDGYLLLRQRSVGGASASGTWTQIGGGLLFTQVPVTGATIPSDTTARALSLWNLGTASNDPPPVGWQSPAYDDSSSPWVDAVVVTDVGAATPFASTDPIWNDMFGCNPGEIVLLRRHFLLGPGMPTVSTLELETAIDGTAISWVNNVYVGSSVDPAVTNVDVLPSVFVTAVSPGADNVLATQVTASFFAPLVGPVPPPVEVIATSSGVTADVVGAPLALVIPDGVADGDLVVLLMQFYNSGYPWSYVSALNSGGWSAQDSTGMGGAFDVDTYSWHRVWHTGDPMTYTYTDVSAPILSYCLLVVRGCDPTTPREPWNSTRHTFEPQYDWPYFTHSVNRRAQGIITTRPNSLLVWWAAALGSAAMTPPDGYTLLGQGSELSGASTMLVAYKQMADAGSTGPQVGGTADDQFWSTLFWAYQPPATPGVLEVEMFDWWGFYTVDSGTAPVTYTLPLSDMVPDGVMLDGDVILVLVSNDFTTHGLLYDTPLSSPWVNDLSGNWTGGWLLASDGVVDATLEVSFIVVYRVWHTGDPMSYALPCNPGVMTGAYVLRGCDQTSPIAASTSNAGTSAIPTGAGLTTSRTYNMLLWVSVSAQGDPGYVLIPSGYQESSSFAIGAFKVDIGYGPQVPVGATGDIPAETADNVTSWRVQLLAFQTTDLPILPAWASYALEYS